METLDELFKQIDEIVEALENPDIAIEEAFGKYEKGMELLKTCNEKIDTIEKKVLVISENGETNEF